MSANPLDAEQLIERFTELERQAADLVPVMRESVAAKALAINEQFALLTKTLLH
jgi:hypothetical protein